MTLKQLLDTLDGADEGIKPYYKQLENGKFALDVEEAVDLKAALEKERKNSQSLRNRLDSLKGLEGIDADEYARLKEEATRREAEEAKKRGEYEKLEKQLIAKHKEEMEKALAENRAIRQEREAAFVASEIAREIATAKGNHKLLEPAISRQVKALEQDGKLTLAVLGRDGSPRVKDGAGNPFTVADLVAEMKGSEDFSAAFMGSGASGSGARTANAPSSAPQGAVARYEALRAKAEANTLTEAEGFELFKLGTQVRDATAQANPT
jgi:hypothetical protein